MKQSLFAIATLFIVVSAQAAEPAACSKVLWEGEGGTNCVYERDTIILLGVLAESEVAQAYASIQAEGIVPNGISLEIKDDATEDFGNTQKFELSFGKCHGPFGPATAQGRSFKVSRRLDKRIMDAAIYRSEVSRIKRFTIRCRG